MICASSAERFMVCPDGQAYGWFELLAMANLPGWIDATDMTDEEFQRFVVERQAVRPYILN